jgi:hypothetical protein
VVSTSFGTPGNTLGAQLPSSPVPLAVLDGTSLPPGAPLSSIAALATAVLTDHQKALLSLLRAWIRCFFCPDMINGFQKKEFLASHLNPFLHSINERTLHSNDDLFHRFLQEVLGWEPQRLKGARAKIWLRPRDAPQRKAEDCQELERLLQGFKKTKA